MNIRPVKITHLVFGLAFVGLAGLWLLGTIAVDPNQLALALPGVLILAGVAGLAATMVNQRRSRSNERIVPEEES